MSNNTVEIIGLLVIAFGLALVVIALGLLATWAAVLAAGVFAALAGGVVVYVANKNAAGDTP